MTRHHIWIGLRPIIAAALAMSVWIAAMWLTSLFPGVNGGKFLSDLGFAIAGGLFLILLLVVIYFLRLRWWDCAVPVVIPLWIVGFDITDYWTGRVWLAFVLPIALSSGFAALRYHDKKVT